MNSLRLSDSVASATCSADTVVPRMTKKSTPARSTTPANSCARWGLSEPATGTPASRTCCIRSVINSALIGSAYSCCMRRVAFTWSEMPASSASSGSGSA